MGGKLVIFRLPKKSPHYLPDHLGDHLAQSLPAVSQFSAQRGLVKRHAHGPLCEPKAPLVPLSGAVVSGQVSWAQPTGHPPLAFES